MHLGIYQGAQEILIKLDALGVTKELKGFFDKDLNTWEFYQGVQGVLKRRFDKGPKPF